MNQDKFQTATTIYRQVGKMAMLMIGAKQFAASDDSLVFKVGRNAKSVNRLKITLDASDTYTVTAYSIRGIDIKQKGQMTGVYNDQLNSVIETLTGMYTRL